MLGMLRSFFGLESQDAPEIVEARAMHWRQFESVVREAFRRRGYSIVERARDAADAGVDLILRKDGALFCVACKQWKASKIGVKTIRELAGAITLREAAGGFFITCGTYTEEARQVAKATSIDLMEGPALAQLVLDARRPEPFMDPTEGRRQTSFRELEGEPACPLCGSAMVKRTVASGSQKGKSYWGCLQSPQCRGMRQA